MESKNWIIHYCLNSSLDGVATIQLKALSEFNEVGLYTENECDIVLNIINSTPLPKFEKRYWWGALTFEEWDDFTKNVDDKIRKELNLEYGE